MNGEAEYKENGKYEAGKPEHLLAVFIDTWFGPKGRAGDGQTWRCGLMATALSYLMSASQCPHEVVGGSVTYKDGGKEHTIDHIWIEVLKDEFKEGEPSHEIYDPSRKQFGVTDYKTLKYEPSVRWPAVKFLPLVFQTGEQNDPVIQEIASVVKNEDNSLTLGVCVMDDFPAIELKLSASEALSLAERIHKTLAVPQVPVKEWKQVDVQVTVQDKGEIEKQRYLLKEKYDALLSGPREELDYWTARLTDKRMPMEWKAHALMEVNEHALRVATIEKDYQKEIAELTGKARTAIKAPEREKETV